jgi:hypothetical protein
MAAVAAEYCRCVRTAVSTIVVVASWVFIRHDQPALEWEVASCSDPCPWSEE